MQLYNNHKHHLNDNKKKSPKEVEQKTLRISKSPSETKKDKDKDKKSSLFEEHSDKELDQINQETDLPDRADIGNQDYN